MSVGVKTYSNGFDHARARACVCFDLKTRARQFLENPFKLEEWYRTQYVLATIPDFQQFTLSQASILERLSG